MADQLQDLKQSWLERETALVGLSVPDLESAWLSAQLGYDASLEDSWNDYLILQGYRPEDGALPDRWHKWLAGLGHTQEALPEQWFSYYSM